MYESPELNVNLGFIINQLCYHGTVLL